MQEITVHVVEYGQRKNLVMRYVDPLTGRQKTKSAGTSKRREAEKCAAKWEAELREGRYNEPSKVLWADFREKYEEEVLPGLADRTGEKVCGVFSVIESILLPERLCHITATRISYYIAQLRKRGRSESTIKSHLSHLKAALRWAHRQGMMPVVPNIDMPKRAKGSKVMKGRPITSEEFERMLDKVQSVVGPKATPSWQCYLNGLWLSGLRLSESLNLYWERDDCPHCDCLEVDLGGKRPIFRVSAEAEKGNEDRELPMAPEFAEFLLKTPSDLRRGPVFAPRAKREDRACYSRFSVGDIVSEVGKVAGVVVDRTMKGAEGKKVTSVKYASAHDLRRAFGQRWAARVMPQILMQLMRHETIETTMRYYVGRDAQATADVLWEAHEEVERKSGNILGNTRHSEDSLTDVTTGRGGT